MIDSCKQIHYHKFHSQDCWQSRFLLNIFSISRLTRDRESYSLIRKSCKTTSVNSSIVPLKMADCQVTINRTDPHAVFFCSDIRQNCFSKDRHIGYIFISCDIMWNLFLPFSSYYMWIGNHPVLDRTLQCYTHSRCPKYMVVWYWNLKLQQTRIHTLSILTSVVKAS